MFSLSLVLIFVVSIVVMWWINRNINGTKGLKPIPGPYGIPLLGNLLQVGTMMHLAFVKWADKYGDVFQVKLGSKPAVVISDPKLVKEIFTVDPAFAGRQFFEGFELYENEPLGIVVTEGEFWETHRRFLLRNLRDFGFGKNTMEQLILEEVKETINRLKTFKDGKVKNVKDIFLLAVVNSLWTVVSSKRFKHDDPQLMQILQDSHRITDELVKRGIYFLVPWTRRFLPKVKDFDEIRERNKRFYVQTVDEHKATTKEGNIRDFIDVYLVEMKANENNPKSAFYGSRAERQLHNILSDLLFAGSDTTSNTLGFAVLYLAKFKHVQEKLQKEISAITGDSRCVTVSDRRNMPYTLALMDEIFRFSSIIPNGVQHRATTGKEFKGYFIPKDTWIFPNLYYIHYSPKYFGPDPQNFRPERFLSDDGKTYKKNENLMPFQVGRRQCVGETLARDTFFLFLTNLYQKFSISLDPNEPEPSLDANMGVVLSAKDYVVVLTDRKINVL